MKKIIALLLALCLMVTFVACGETPNGSSDKDNSSTDSGSAEVVNVADFKGAWKIDKGEVSVVDINDTDSSVTAYNADGFVIATFPAVATEKGLVLKMGAYGEVTLENTVDLTSATITAPTNKADISGEWTYFFGDLPQDTVLNVKSDGTFVITGSKADSGTYSYTDNDTVGLSPSKELGGAVSHEVLGGGKILNATDPSVRYYVNTSALATDTGKAMKTYYELIANEWSDADGAVAIEFKNSGKIFISGAEMGIWYPTANGATIEYSDGENKDDITVNNGTFNLAYYGKDFSKK